jgi:hypothetical protein
MFAMHFYVMFLAWSTFLLILPIVCSRHPQCYPDKISEFLCLPCGSVILNLFHHWVWFFSLITPLKISGPQFANRMAIPIYNSSIILPM